MTVSSRIEIIVVNSPVAPHDTLVVNVPLLTWRIVGNLYVPGVPMRVAVCYCWSLITTCCLASSLFGQETMSSGDSNEKRVMLVISGIPQNATVSAIPVDANDEQLAHVNVVVQASDTSVAPIIRAVVRNQNENQGRDITYDWYSNSTDDSATIHQSNRRPLNTRDVIYDDFSTVDQADPRVVRYDDYSTVGQFGPPHRAAINLESGIDSTGCCDEWDGYCQTSKRSWKFCRCFQLPGNKSHRDCDRDRCSCR